MAKFIYSISPPGAGTIKYTLSPSSYGTLRWTITPASGYSFYAVDYTSGRDSGSFTIDNDMGFMPTWPDSGTINFNIKFEVAGGFGFFSNIEEGSFSGAMSSSPLTDKTNDGSWYRAVRYPYNSHNTWKITANVPEGYRFVGWYTLSANRKTTNWYQITQAMLSSTSLSASKTFKPNIANLRTFLGESSTSRQYYLLYAKYDNKWTISLDQKGGSGGTHSITATYGQSMPQIAVPTRTGYTFVGYFDTDSASGGTQYYTSIGESATTWDKTYNATLYARWTPNTYTITLNPNGGSEGTESVIATYESAMPSATMPTRTGYTFNGFYDTSSSTGGTQYYTASGASARSWDKASNATLYARWQNSTPTRTITFNAVGGTSSESQRTLDKGSQIGTLPTAIRDGYTFKGWFLQPSGGTAIPTDYVVDEDLYLYAQWSGNPYTITFNGNGGTPDISSKTVSYGEKYGWLPSCHKAKYTFTGWFTSMSGGTKMEESVIFNQKSDQTLYAHWSNVDPAIKWYYLVLPKGD